MRRNPAEDAGNIWSRLATLPQVRLQQSERFVILPENRFAYSVLEQLSTAQEGPTQPLVFIRGPAGCGKSLLLQSTLRGLLRPPGNSKCASIYILASSLMTLGDAWAPVEDASDEGLPSLFLCEDLQALQGHRSTQQLLVALIDALRLANIRCVITSTQSPTQLHSFLPKLLNRLRGGVSATIRSPGPSSRARLLEHFAQAEQLPLNQAVIELLSSRLAVSPRELKAAFRQFETAARVRRSPLSPEFATRFLDGEFPTVKISLTSIGRAVAKHFGVTIKLLRSPSRSQSLVVPRQVGMLLARELTDCSLQQIAEYFGRKNHSTVVHSCDKLAEMSAGQPELRRQIAQLLTELRQSDMGPQ